jgi:phosphoribosylcarboxyaminoimidazole (NCAIR) mutase
MSEQTNTTDAVETAKNAAKEAVTQLAKREAELANELTQVKGQRKQMERTVKVLEGQPIRKRRTRNATAAA